MTVSFGAVIVAIVRFVILSYAIRAAMRDGILAAWRIRNRSQGWASHDRLPAQAVLIGPSL